MLPATDLPDMADRMSSVDHVATRMQNEANSLENSAETQPPMGTEIRIINGVEVYENQTSCVFYFAARTFRHHARSRVRRLDDMSRVRGM
jgi:hypothetical protein